MKKFTLYVGLNDKDTKTQQIETLDAYKMVENVCLSKTTGYTIGEVNGYYRHEDGTISIEKSFRIELLFIPEAVALEICDTLKVILNQESIAFEVTETDARLI